MGKSVYIEGIVNVELSLEGKMSLFVSTIVLLRFVIHMLI